mmetsp:Transcript_28113/g.39563  ORF Transcript_28113/g.39563 Transcript_28113/m.39563 type:complete len:125 (-) Transcript_28113:122-496(-)
MKLFRKSKAREDLNTTRRSLVRRKSRSFTKRNKGKGQNTSFEVETQKCEERQPPQSCHKKKTDFDERMDASIHSYCRKKDATHLEAIIEGTPSEESESKRINGPSGRIELEFAALKKNMFCWCF